MTIDQDDRASRRDDRERDLMVSMALIAPSPELLRRVVELGLLEPEPPATDVPPSGAPRL